MKIDSKKLITGPKSPMLVQLFQWFNDPLRYLDRNYEQYGDVFILPFSLELSPTIFVGNPKIIEYILTHESDIFYPFSQTMIKQGKAIIGEMGLAISPNAEKHREWKKLLTPSFHGKAIKGCADQILKISRDVLHSIRPEEAFDVLSVVRLMNERILYQCVFGLDDDENSKQLQNRFNTWADFLDSPLLLAAILFPTLRWTVGCREWQKFSRLTEEISDFLNVEIAKRIRQTAQERHDILTLLLASHGDKWEGCPGIKIQSQCKELIAASLSTTAAAMAWLCFSVYSRPEVLENVRQEVASLGAASEALEIAQLPYLTAVCQECLRLHTVDLVSLTRVVKRSVDVEGYLFEAGQKVVACPYLVHQREDIYPQPQEFRPERFLKRKFSPYEYLPFGGGSRRCLGSELALLSLKLMLATFVQTPGLELALSQPVKPVRRVIGDVQPANLKMILRPFYG